MTVQEEYAVLQMEFARYKSKSEDNFTAIFVSCETALALEVDVKISSGTLSLITLFL